MAETEIEEFAALRQLLFAASTEAVAAADDAAAEVYLRAAIAAAPVGKGKDAHPGQLRESIAIVGSDKSKLLSSIQGDVTRRIFVGPTRKKGYYGYFVEKGWTATGPKRRERPASGNIHAQHGATGGHEVEGRPWFDPAIKGAEAAAMEAAETAFDRKLQELDSRA